MDQTGRKLDKEDNSGKGQSMHGYILTYFTLDREHLVNSLQICKPVVGRRMEVVVETALRRREKVTYNDCARHFFKSM